MAKTVNRVTLIGVVDRDPETRDFPSGGQVLSLWVRTSEQWNDRQTGEMRERSQVNRVGVYVAPMINALKDTLRTNDLVYVEGRMETRRTQDDRYFTEVSVRPYHGSIAALGPVQIDATDPHPDGPGYGGQADTGFSSGVQRGSDPQPNPGMSDSIAREPDDEMPF